MKRCWLYVRRSLLRSDRSSNNCPVPRPIIRKRRCVSPTQELVRWRGTLEGYSDDLEDRYVAALITGRRVKPHGHARCHTQNSVHPCETVRSRLTHEPATEWITPLWGERVPHGPWVKITQPSGRGPLLPPARPRRGPLFRRMDGVDVARRLYDPEIWQ
jgi:hypothetical protein